MKISLLTLQYIPNYGSVLQTYATQFLFASAGCEVEVVNYVRPNCRRTNILANQLQLDKLNGGIRSYPGIKNIVSYKRKRYFERLDRVFQSFILKYIHL